MSLEASNCCCVRRAQQGWRAANCYNYMLRAALQLLTIWIARTQGRTAQRRFKASGRMAALRGKINEKERDGRPAAELARLTHALWGLDHYPSYLKRWRDGDIAELEDQLERTLATVKAARRANAEEAAGVVETEKLRELRDPANWRVGDVVAPRLAKVLGWDACPSMADALAAPRKAAPARGVLALLDEVVDDVYSIDVLTPAFCERLLEAVDGARSDDGEPLPRANLDVVGCSWLGDVLLAVGAQVQAAAHPAETLGGALDWRHAYVLKYEPTGRDSLVHHTDDSEITVNVCLGRDFAGGDLLLGGVRGAPDETSARVDRVAPKRGVATVHLGRHLHAVDTVTRGERRVLICWCRSLSGARSSVCPCCWMNRRAGGASAGDCICGPAWNS